MCFLVSPNAYVTNFNIDPNTGVLSVGTAFDREEMSSSIVSVSIKVPTPPPTTTTIWCWKSYSREVIHMTLQCGPADIRFFVSVVWNNELWYICPFTLISFIFLDLGQVFYFHQFWDLSHKNWAEELKFLFKNPLR